MTIDITPPPAVVKLVEQSGYTKGVDYIGKWNNYTVYSPNYSDIPKGEVWGLPSYILYKDNQIRWADVDECEDIMELEN